MNEKLKITPLTRIGDLLDAFPELEDVLIGLAPAFSKLKNPILRRTVAKVATVQKAASIAGIDAREMVTTLRRAAGQSVEDLDLSDSESEGGGGPHWPEPPTWLDASKAEQTIDAEALLQAGEVPLGRVVQAARGLAGDQFLLVTSGFRPVPLIEALEKQGHRGFVRQIGPDRFETYVGPFQGNEIQGVE
jgi:hypothetical protein